MTRSYLIWEHTHRPVKVIYKTVHFGCGRETTNEWNRDCYRVSHAVTSISAFSIYEIFYYKYYVHYSTDQAEYNREYKRSKISAFAWELFQFFDVEGGVEI